jgi:imidazolonepropionase-like amidohydrolase
MAGCGQQERAADPARTQSQATVLRDFTLIDGTGAAPQPASSMIVRDGRIEWVGPTAQLKAPDGARTVDLTGKYVTPGLIDLHVHLGITKGLEQSFANFTRESVERDLKTYASYGVTTVLSMGTDGDEIFKIRDEQRAGRPTMTRVYTAGQGLVFKGGYGGIPNNNRPVATPEEAAREVDLQASKGVDFIKLWVDDELGTMPVMPPEISKAVIDAAHRHNLRALAHVFYLRDAKRLVDQGVDGLAHSVRDQPVDQALIDSMKSRGVWQLAETLSREAAMFAYGEPAPFLDDPFFRAGVSPEVIEQLRSPERQQKIASGPNFHDYPKFLKQAQDNLIRLEKGGVKIGFGTDSGPVGRFPGYFSHWELELMVQAGTPPLDALRIATSQAAEFLGAKDLGSVQAGKWADLVILDADPSADIKNMRKINSVYIAGNETAVVKPQ